MARNLSRVCEARRSEGIKLAKERFGAGPNQFMNTEMNRIYVVANAFNAVLLRMTKVEPLA